MEYFKAIGVNTLVANIVAKLSADIEIRLNEKEVTQVIIFRIIIIVAFSGCQKHGHYYGFDHYFTIH